MVIKYNFIMSLRRALSHMAVGDGILAEWLRRKIRNLLGSARAGSNPADVVLLSKRAKFFTLETSSGGKLCT